MEDFAKIVEKKFPDDFEEVAKTVNHAVMSSNPHLSYIVGDGWWVYRILQVVPVIFHRWFLSIAYPSFEVKDSKEVAR